MLHSKERKSKSFRQKVIGNVVRTECLQLHSDAATSTTLRAIACPPHSPPTFDGRSTTGRACPKFRASSLLTPARVFENPGPMTERRVDARCAPESFCLGTRTPLSPILPELTHLLLNTRWADARLHHTRNGAQPDSRYAPQGPRSRSFD